MTLVSSAILNFSLEKMFTDKRKGSPTIKKKRQPTILGVWAASMKRRDNKTYINYIGMAGQNLLDLLKRLMKVYLLDNVD